MRTNIQRFLELCIVLSLALTWGCVKVNVSVQAQNSRDTAFDDSWISMEDLKKLHMKQWCDPSAWDIPKERQKTPAWCWAASTRIVMEYWNRKHNKQTDLQCTIARQILGPSLNEANCCDSNPSTQCIQGAWPNRVLDHYQFNYKKLAGAFNDWDALTGEICSIGPFISVIEWNGGGKHALVVTGYRNDRRSKDPKNVVTIYDPTSDDIQDLIFDEFVGGSLEGPANLHEFSHYLSYVQIVPMTKDQP